MRLNTPPTVVGLLFLWAAFMTYGMSRVMLG